MFFWIKHCQHGGFCREKKPRNLQKYHEQTCFLFNFAVKIDVPFIQSFMKKASGDKPHIVARSHRNGVGRPQRWMATWHPLDPIGSLIPGLKMFISFLIKNKVVGHAWKLSCLEPSAFSLDFPFIYACFITTSLFSFDLALFVSVLGCFSCFPENVKHEEFGDLQGIPSHYSWQGRWLSVDRLLERLVGTLAALTFKQAPSGLTLEREWQWLQDVDTYCNGIRIQ